MNGEIICIGTELLLGDTLNSNSQYLSKELSNIGINIYYHSVVGDNPIRLENILTGALERSNIIVTTGGLGPTQDDLTKETISQLLNIPLEMDESSLDHIKSFFTLSNNKMTSNNIKQSFKPKNSIIIPNKNGTAPGIIIEKNEKIIIMLPGPPREMIPMMENYVIPYLSKKYPVEFYSRYYKIIGIGESALEEKLIDLIDTQKNPTLATYAGNNEVQLRMTANAKNEDMANDILNSFENIIYERIGENIYGGKDDTLESVVGNLLINNNISIALAESCTGGMITSKLTEISGISKVLHSGIVCYSNDAKRNIVGVSDKSLKKFGAVSPEIAEELCRELYKKTHADLVISTTGIAGPAGGSEDKPVGLIYIALLYGDTIKINKLNLYGDRKKIQNKATKIVFDMIRKKINTII